MTKSDTINKNKQPVKIKVVSCYSGKNNMKQTFEAIAYEQVKNKLEQVK